MTVFIVAFTLSAYADKSRVPTYKFSVVPQQSESRTTLVWKPVLQFLSKDTGYKFQLNIARDIPSFERHLLNAQYDFSYIVPQHYAVIHDALGYVAIVKAKIKKAGDDAPQIVVAHPRVPLFVLNRIQASLIRLNENEQGGQMLSQMKVEGCRAIENSY